MLDVKRRQFIKLLGGAAAAWPLAARAEQPGKMRRIGALTTLSDSDRLMQAHFAAFRKGLDEWGWRDGKNVKIDYRWAGGDLGRLRAFAKQLVEVQPDLIFGVTTPSVAALLQETRTLPIVFAQVSDPVGSGFVASLARPGGNVTGFTNINIDPSIGGKYLSSLRRSRPRSGASP
jgi:putative ABC transport system substrate-binding protein